MVSPRASIRLVLITVLLALSGCASFREGASQAPVSWPIINVPAKQSISLLMTHEAIMNGWRISVPQQQVQKVEEIVARAYKDSGLFSDVKIGAADTDFRAEVHVLYHVQFSEWLAYAAGVTLSLIPGYEQREFVITTTLKNRELRSLGTFEKVERETTWIQLFLIFIMPFYWPNSVTGELVYDLNRAIISQAYGTGVLQSRELPVKTRPVAVVSDEMRCRLGIDC